MSAAAGDRAARLAPVRWIGGGSGAGKSAVARRLAATTGLPVYATDDTMADHARRADPASTPALTAFAAMDMDERWVRRSPEDMLATFHWYRGEAFDLVVDDLLDLVDGPDAPAATGVIAEGFRLLPALVAPLLDGERRAVWLLPTPAFRERAFEERGTIDDIPHRTSDPARARRNLLARDAMFTDRLREEVAGLGLTAIEVDVGGREDDLVEEVRHALQL